MPNKDFHFKKVKQLHEGIVKECKHSGNLMDEEEYHNENNRKLKANGIENL